MAEKENPLKSLENDLIFYSDSMKEVAYEILDEKVSRYPIFIAHQHEVSLGEILLNKNEFGSEWNVQVSTLEEFIKRGVIEAEKEDYFIQNYKDPRKFMCVLVIVPEGANFIFYPYK